MSKVDELKSAIEALPEDEYVELKQWFSEKEWQDWDEEIAADSNSGKLDFLRDEANDQKKERQPSGSLRIHKFG